jgi:ribosomal protein L11 methyltransferase
VQYVEISLSVPPDAVEGVADIMRSIAPSGISIEPCFEAIEPEEGLAQVDLTAPVRLRAWLPASERTSDLTAALQEQLQSLDSTLVPPLGQRIVQDQDWAAAWKEHFHVIHAGGRTVIRPSWREYEPQDGEIVLNLDPGMAFGTGQHATTRMCLAALEGAVAPGSRILDLGCGSGILAIAAALHGASHVDAIDTDPAAITATKANSGRNDVGRIVRTGEGSLGESWPFDEPPSSRYDAVVANLSSRLVRELSSDILAAIKRDGVALLSGMVQEQERTCIDALAAAGGRVLDKRREEGWVLLRVTRGRKG